MSAARLAMIGAVGAVVAWAAKAVAIGMAGGLDRSSAESPLFLLGLVCALVGAGALGAAITAGSSTARRVLAGFAAIVALLMVALLVNTVAVALQPDDPSWVWAEVNLWVSALVLLGVVLSWRRRAPHGTALV